MRCSAPRAAGEAFPQATARCTADLPCWLSRVDHDEFAASCSSVKATAVAAAAPALTDCARCRPRSSMIDGSSCRTSGWPRKVGRIAQGGTELDQDFAHHRHHDDLAWFAALAQPPCKGFDFRIEAHRTASRIEQDHLDGSASRLEATEMRRPGAPVP